MSKNFISCRSSLLLVSSLILLISLLLITSGCTEKTENQDNITTNGGKIIETGKYADLELTLELEKSTFQKGEYINATVTLKNNGDQPISFIYTNFDVYIYFPEGFDTDVVSIMSEDSQQEENITINSGESINKNVKWDQSYDTIDEGQKKIGVGEYNLVAYFDADNDQEQYELETEPITVDIED